MRRQKPITSFSNRASATAWLLLVGGLLCPAVGQSQQSQPLPQTKRQSGGAIHEGTAGSAGVQGTAAQGTIAQGTIQAPQRAQVIRTVLERLNASYVFPETARRMEAAIQARVANKEYDSLTDAQTFAEKLSQDLRAVCHDKHLGLRYSAAPVPEDAPLGGVPSPAEQENMRRIGASINWGFERVERLPGNIGYLELRGFAPPEGAGETLAAAMNFLAGTEALIIDLRRNGGGEPGMVALLCSYFVEEGGDGLHLNDIYWRPDNSMRQYWTLPHVAGKRYGKTRGLYLLTGHDTLSAAEEFAYDLKNLRRAVIVGETTGGAANHGNETRISEHFALYLPMGRAINPLTKTNWEGKGVAPDIAAAAPQALQTARAAILRQRASSTSDPQQKQALLQEAAQVLK